MAHESISIPLRERGEYKWRNYFNFIFAIREER